MQTETNRRVALRGFARALAHESHVLAGRSELLWQQLHNRLQWWPDPVATLVEAERGARSLPGAAPWARTRAPAHREEYPDAGLIQGRIVELGKPGHEGVPTQAAGH